MPEVITEEALTLSAQHVTGAAVDDDGVPLFRISDGEQAVELTHEIGDPERAAQALLELADAIREHAEQIRYRDRMRSAGWT